MKVKVKVKVKILTLIQDWKTDAEYQAHRRLVNKKTKKSHAHKHLTVAAVKGTTAAVQETTRAVQQGSQAIVEAQRTNTDAVKVAGAALLDAVRDLPARLAHELRGSAAAALPSPPTACI